MEKKAKAKGYNKLGRMGMVYTPNSMKELEDRLSEFKGQTEVHVMAWAAWNLACKLQAENEANGWVKKGFDKD